MILGISAIQVFHTFSDEWGVYRIDRVENQDRKFHMFPCTEREEALFYGQAIAKRLGVPYRGARVDTLPVPKTDTGTDNPVIVEEGLAELAESANTPPTTPPSKPPRFKKVMGVAKIIQECMNNGLSDEEITTRLLSRYLETGRDEKDARWTISVSIDNIKSIK